MWPASVRWSPIRRSCAVALLALAGCGGGDEPPAVVEPVRLDSAVVTDALGKQAEALRAAEAATAAAASGELDGLLAPDPLDLSLPEVSRGGVTLHEVTVRRRGPDAVGEATVDLDQLAAFAPEGVELRYDAEASVDAGGAIVLSGSARAFGLTVPVTVRVAAEDGAVVAIPEGLPIGRQVLFADPRVHVRRVAAREVPGGLRVRAEATISPT